MDGKSMATPMRKKLEKLSDYASNLELVDPTMYRQLIISLMYLVNTRLYILFAVNTMSQHNVELRNHHWVVEKHVLRYLCGTMGYDLRYVSGGEVGMQEFVDSDWEGSAVD